MTPTERPPRARLKVVVVRAPGTPIDLDKWARTYVRRVLAEQFPEIRSSLRAD